MRNLILDIDNTLIFSHYLGAHYKFDIPSAFWTPNHPDIFPIFDSYKTKRRDGLKKFLDFCFKNFNVGIWTVADKEYAEVVLKNIGIEEDNLFLFKSREDCIYRPDIKQRLKPIDSLKEDVIVIDDKPHVIMAKKKDVILPIKPYYGSDGDEELSRMIYVLEKFIV